MLSLKTLLKDTAVYGISSMLGRLLNWLLTYVYVRVLLQEEMGQMSNLYAWVAVLMALITYGMETTFFRFVNKSDRPREVYATALMIVGVNALVFVLLFTYYLDPIICFLGYESLGEQSTLMLKVLGGIIALDAFCAIPLAYLRYAQRPWRFMLVRISFVLFTIVATLGLFYLSPLIGSSPLWLHSLREKALLSIFGINLLASILQFVMLIPTFGFARWSIDRHLIRQMLSYASPILFLGLIGVFNTQIDKIIFPLLFADPSQGQVQLGIYSACYKIAVIMLLFTQAFRYAYDPFVFAKAKEGEQVAKGAYAQSMKYYVYFALCIFLAVLSLMDILKYFVTPEYYDGLLAVPLVMFGQLMFGVYFNLSLWYKLTDKTIWGTLLSLIGTVVLLLWIVLGASSLGFMACAWGLVCSNVLMVLLSYLLGQRYYPISYPLKHIGLFTLLAIVLGIIQMYLGDIYAEESLYIRLSLKLLIFITFVVLLACVEFPLGSIKMRLCSKLSKRINEL